MLLDDLTVDADDFAHRSGWELKPQGACRGDVCVPMPDTVRVDGDRLDVRVLADRLAMPLVSAPEHGKWALGPGGAGGGRVLDSAVAPELELPDADGNLFKLSSLHGQKVLLIAWASW
jgi:hypothetical protein